MTDVERCHQLATSWGGTILSCDFPDGHHGQHHDPSGTWWSGGDDDNNGLWIFEDASRWHDYRNPPEIAAALAVVAIFVASCALVLAIVANLRG